MDLNLVPYIDLLTCMIAFLLITAVWTQVVGLRNQGRSEGGDPAAVPIALTVVVGELGFNVVVGERSEPLPRAGSTHDFPALEAALARLKAGHPDREDVRVASEDAVPYETLVRTMDTVLAAGFPAVSLTAL